VTFNRRTWGGGAAGHLHLDSDAHVLDGILAIAGTIAGAVEGLRIFQTVRCVPEPRSIRVDGEVKDAPVIRALFDLLTDYIPWQVKLRKLLSLTVIECVLACG
jgi:hypothetical protein